MTSRARRPPAPRLSTAPCHEPTNLPCRAEGAQKASGIQSAAQRRTIHAETLTQRSVRLDLDGIDFTTFSERPLDPETLRCLGYMHDVEHHIICCPRDLLVTRAHRDPDVTAFLACWSYEENWHGEALALVLAAHGEPRALTIFSRLGHLLSLVGAPEEAGLCQVIFGDGVIRGGPRLRRDSERSVPYASDTESGGADPGQTVGSGSQTGSQHSRRGPTSANYTRVFLQVRGS